MSVPAVVVQKLAATPPVGQRCDTRGCKAGAVMRTALSVRVMGASAYVYRWACEAHGR